MVMMAGVLLGVNHVSAVFSITTVLTSLYPALAVVPGWAILQSACAAPKWSG